MSLYEYWCEQYGAKPRGSIQFNTQHVAQRSFWVVALKGLMASVVTGFLILVTTMALPLPGWQGVIAACGLVLVYVGIAFLVVPEPNTDNLGWLGGIVDDPFQYSDDWNRSLVSLSILLGPGKFVSGTLLDVADWCGIATSDEPQETFGCEDGDYAAGVSTANATAVDLPPTADRMNHDQAQQEITGLSTARFLINDDA